jgi:uncharacterized heparinase superfamily protein
MGTRDFFARLALPLWAGERPDSPATPAALRLRTTITRLVPGNPEQARAMYRGDFSLGGEVLAVAPADLFAQTLSPAASAALHGLAWLRDFAAAPRSLTNVMARRLLAAWAETPARPADAMVAATALLNLCLDGPVLFDGAPLGGTPSLARLVSQQASRVLGQRRNDPGLQLWQGVALCHALTIFHGLDHLREPAESRLARGLAALVLPDGGPASRQPGHLLELLALLLPLRQAMFSARLPVPEALHHALERMVPMLRLLRHGDGGLALFHGASPAGDDVARLLALDATEGRPMALALHSGFARVAQGQALLMADTSLGGPHHSTLAIEFSDGAQRILANCGSPLWGNADWRAAASRSHAHNGLSHDGPAVAAATPTLETAAAGSMLTMAARFGDGLAQTRECFLAANGQDLRVCDTLSGRDAPVTLRLHLHPTVKVTSFRQGETLLLMLPNRAVWEFEARGADTRLEDSISMAESKGPRRSQQIVLTAPARVAGHAIHWALRKRLKPAKIKPAAEPALPGTL